MVIDEGVKRYRVKLERSSILTKCYVSQQRRIKQTSITSLKGRPMTVAAVGLLYVKASKALSQLLSGF